MATYQRKGPKWNVTLTKGWNWSSCKMLALSASWTYGLISQSYGASERNSVVMGVHISLGPTLYSYFEESVWGECHIYQLTRLHSRVLLEKKFIKINVGTVEEKHLKWNVRWNKRWNWRSCTKALSAIGTHGLKGPSVRVSACNSVLVGINPTRAKFLYLLQRICQWWIPYILAHSSTVVWLPTEKFD